ncbi:MAG: hypothetical protein ACOX6D_06605 [Thermoguttaceae bacterium]|jgi:hypothetical protein
MKEIKNFKGEIVKVESSDGENWWRLSSSAWLWLLISGLILFNIGCFVKPSLIDSLLHFLDMRLWPWELFVIILVGAGFSFQCWRICRDYDEYYDYEKKHARNFIAFGVTVLVILLFLLFLSMTGRFFLFFRPIGNWFVRGHYTLQAVGRSALVVVSLIPLIYFGKEWICGFWDE